MNASSRSEENVKGLVPLLAVSSMERSLRYYVDGLGFTMKNKWVVDGKVRWCWLELGGAALMLQETAGQQGVALWFQCKDAIGIYHDVRSRGLAVSEPQVGNAMWETSLSDPNGYRLNFGSPTDVPEETKLSELKG